MGCKTNEASDGWSQECLMDDQSQFYDPLMLMANSEAEAEDNGLSTMEKIFLFAKSGNSYHRVIVSQRLPDLLEDVDITEAVEYVLPLLSGLASDEESVQEALAPSLCNIMWYYFSKCHLSQINFNHQNSSQDFLLAERECTEIDWQPTSRRKRPEISVGSFMAPIVTLLAESNRSVSLLTRFGLLVLLCRLTDRPFPSCSGEVISISSEPFFPVEERSKEEDQIYEEYGFEEPVRRSIALELAEAIVYELCRLNQVCQIQMRDGPSESESEEWDTVPLVGEEIELELPNQSGPKGCTNQMDAAIFFDESSELEFSSLDCDSFLLHSSRRRNYNCVLDEPMDMSNEPQNIRRHIGLTLIESFIQTDCFGSDFKNFKLLPVITRVMPGEDSRAVRQQAASSLSAFMEAFLTSSQSSSDRMWCTNSAAEVRKAVIECYSKFAADPDYEVRRQICLCLPSMVRIVWGRAAEKITLHYLDYFSKDETQEVRIICCQTLGELIYLFHEKRCTVPPKLAGYFIHGFGERPYKESCSGRATYEQLRSIGKSMDLASSLIRNYEGFGMSNGPGAYQSILPTPSCSANLHSKEQIEMAMCCAYNFPAVFLTLGVDRWHDLRDLFLKLATDVSFPNKIRKSLACSIHEFLTVIKAEKDKSHQNGLRECHLLKNQKLALEDCLKVLRFFLFNEDALMIESVFENFDRSFENLLVIGEEHLEWVEILKGLNDYFDEESTVALKKVNWRVREQVVLTLPRLLHKLGEFIRSSENSAQKALLEGLKLFETLLFSGLRDCTAAVREAGLKFLPILFEFQRPDLDESRIRILQRLRKMSQDSNYRIRANLPGALLSLVKLPMSVELFESIVLDEKLANICNDRVGGVRIGLSRLVNEICSSKNFYSIESGRRVPLLVQKIMEELSLDCEMVVRSYVDGLSINRGEECVIASGPNTSVGLAEDEEEDDLSGSGIQVFGIRLSEDEGEEVSLGEEIYNTESELTFSHTTNGNNHSSISNQPNRKLLTFNARTGSSPSRKGNRRSISHNQVIGGYDGSVMMGGGAGKRRGNGSSSNGRGIDTLWMRDTDGGFVEVGEY
ncbi:armadillo-type protein [Phakopsora pachyrhizi]|uniref:Armadillo-type protein n=1 Tax=Phakopsora pachyrhizi TaxID=170000 RepID=A0AAV0BIY9_PHAPC|nr:armadillo-type protein [Phakopsora pachyrhizi]CAH7687280.1 armadillo-type protein [Phakopsora pachyrhizi]